MDLSKIKFQASPNFSQRVAGSKIKFLVVHTTQGASPGCTSWLCNPKSNVSAHYVIDKHGQVVQLVHLKDKAWHVGKANSLAVGVEMEGMIEDPHWVTLELWKTAVELFAALCKEFKLPVTAIVGHNSPEMKKYGNCHQDPGSFFDMEKFREEVQRHLGDKQ